MSIDETSGGPLLMVSTIGGSPAPIAESIARARPERVVFVCSKRSAASLTAPDGVRARLEAKGFPLPEARYEVQTLTNEEDLVECVEDMRQFLTPHVSAWLKRSPEHRLWVDFTGGTKCMSVAAGLVARQWPCEMVYVGGSERTKGGLGVTIDGHERFLNRDNPWNALGYESGDQAAAFFNAGHYPAAAKLLREAARRATALHLRRALATFASLAEAYAAWNLFQIPQAMGSLDAFLKNAQDMACFGYSQAAIKRLRREAEAHLGWLAALRSADGPTREWLADLLADALRRMEEQAFDDAVARLYRLLEAAAQLRLKEAHGIASTAAVPLERVPEPLRERWRPRAGNGLLRLGLRDDYELLHQLGDPLAEPFRRNKLHTGASALEARNAARFGHGFQAISEKAARRLLDAALEVAEGAGVQRETLPVFPRLAGE